jgi:hypothetical protein
MPRFDWIFISDICGDSWFAEKFLKTPMDVATVLLLLLFLSRLNFRCPLFLVY